MKKQEISLTILFLAIALTFLSCQKSAAENGQITLQTAPTVSPTSNPSPTLEPSLDSPIRKVDFKSFKYPWVYMDDSGVNYSKNANNSDIDFLELINGIQEKTEEQDGASIQKIEYGDANNDGAEDAIISVVAETGGNCSCDMVYIYSLDDNKPKLLWAFGTGDRADGGLKKNYAENGELVVQLFGDNKFEDDKWKYRIAEGKFNGYCCPTTYTKIRFKWNGEKFIAQGKPELFDYDWKAAQNINRSE